MSGVPVTAAQIPVQNCLNGIYHQLYAVQEKICGLCSTDSKIYVLLILGRTLQSAALVSFAASIVFTLFVGPAAFIGLVPAVAFGVLGTYIADNPQELNAMVQMTRPFVPGQPVGLTNSGNNCWLNSGLQLLANVPAFEPRMRQIPPLAQFLDAYKDARAGYRKVAPNFDSHQVRQFLSTETRGAVGGDHVQEDSSQLFEFLFQGPNALYQFDHLLNGAPATARREPMIQVDIQRVNPLPGFGQLFNGFFDHMTDIGQRQQLFFQHSPNDLLIQLKRFYRDPDGTLGKINDPIDAPETIQLPATLVRTGESAAYQCDAFLIHHGLTQDGGHYVSYIKVGNTWWYCSDSSVIEVSAKDALSAMKQSYILHYAKS